MVRTLPWRGRLWSGAVMSRGGGELAGLLLLEDTASLWWCLREPEDLPSPCEDLCLPDMLNLCLVF